jgi:hypothetical protein
MKSEHQDKDRAARSDDGSQRKGCAGVLLMLWGFPWFAAGTVFLNVVYLAPLYRTVLAINWHATHCTILSRDVENDEVKIVYAYDYAGKEYQSDQYDFNYLVDRTKTDKQQTAVLDRYLPGNQATCYVKPSDPAQAVLNRKFSPSILPSFFALIFMNIGLFAMRYGWGLLRGKKQHREPSPASEIDLRRDSGGVTISSPPLGLFRGFGGWFGGLVSALWILVIIPLTVVVLHAALVDNSLAEQGYWSLLILIPCAFVVICMLSALQAARRRVDLTVRNGVLTVRQSSLFGMHEKQWDAEDLAKVRVAPFGNTGVQSPDEHRADEPWKARLEIVSKDGSSRSYLAHRHESELERIAAELRDALALEKQPTSDWLPTPKVGREHDARREGPVTLRSKAFPVSRFVGYTLFALFWYGFLAFVGRGVLSGFLQGRPDWVSGLKLLPFLLFGLIWIRRAGHSFLALFSPQPTITLSTASPSLGDTVELTWQFSRNASSLQGLEIYLWGEEITRARCSSGGRLHHVSETFAELPVVELTTGMESGTAKMRIPDSTMHSFDAEHNEIAWSIEVFADVSFFPDVQLSFPIVVLPQRIAELISSEPVEN